MIYSRFQTFSKGVSTTWRLDLDLKESISHFINLSQLFACGHSIWPLYLQIETRNAAPIRLSSSKYFLKIQQTSIWPFVSVHQTTIDGVAHSLDSHSYPPNIAYIPSNSHIILFCDKWCNLWIYIGLLHLLLHAMHNITSTHIKNEVFIMHFLYTQIEWIDTVSCRTWYNAQRRLYQELP